MKKKFTIIKKKSIKSKKFISKARRRYRKSKRQRKSSVKQTKKSHKKLKRRASRYYKGGAAADERHVQSAIRLNSEDSHSEGPPPVAASSTIPRGKVIPRERWEKLKRTLRIFNDYGLDDKTAHQIINYVESTKDKDGNPLSSVEQVVLVMRESGENIDNVIKALKESDNNGRGPNTDVALEIIKHKDLVV